MCIFHWATQNIKKARTQGLQLNKINNFTALSRTLLTETGFFLLLCKCRAVMNTMTTSTTVWCHLIALYSTKVLPPIPLHQQCKCQQSENSEYWLTIMKTVLTLQTS